MEIGNVYSTLEKAKENIALFATANKQTEVYITVSLYGRQRQPEFYLKKKQEVISPKSPNVLYRHKNGELKQLHEFKPQNTEEYNLPTL